MNEKTNELLGKLFRVEMLLHRYHVHGFRAHGPFNNPLKGQGRILSILKMKPRISQKELAFLLDMRQQSLSELLIKLESRGYVLRTPLPQDRRTTMIELTEAGEKASAAMEDGDGDFESVFDCLSEEEQTLFAGYLDRLADALERMPEPAGPSDARMGGFPGHEGHGGYPGHGHGHRHHGFGCPRGFPRRGPDDPPDRRP